MTANKHTPGPWEVVNGKDIFTPLGAMNAEGVYAPFNDGWHIASMGECTCSISGEEIGLDYREANANARLIAAAPDNYSSNIELAGIVRELCAAYGHPLPQASLDRSDAAIAKTGGAA